MKTKIKILLIAIFSAGLVFFTCLSEAADILTFTKIGTHPSNRELSGEGADSEAAQGIASDGINWFYSNKTHVYRLKTDFRNRDKAYNAAGIKFGSAKCDHVGGIDYYDGEVYAALDGCSDNKARIVVLDTNLGFKRYAVIHALNNSFPWVAVNPIDAGYFYTISPDGKKKMLAFPRNFANGASLNAVKEVHFKDHPQDKLDHFWVQGGAFSANGLFFRTVDDAKDEDSKHTGIWVYELDYPVVNGSTAQRIGFINIKYDPDQWVPGLCGFDQCKRKYELEDLDVTTIRTGPTIGNVHILLLSNEADEDDVSVLHYTIGDYDADGVIDTLDNCLRISNAAQADLDRNGMGLACDRNEVGSILVPSLDLPLQ